MRFLCLFVLLILSTRAVQADENCFIAHNLCTVTDQQAFDASARAVILHFGDDFDEDSRGSIMRHVSDLGYRYRAYLGGPSGQMSLFIGGVRISQRFHEANAEELLEIALARDAQEFKIAEGCPPEPTSLSTVEAQDLSENRVVIQFGNGFPDHVKSGIIAALISYEYDFCSVEGGPNEMMALYIDGREGKRPFSPADAMGYLLTILDKNASNFRTTPED